MLDQLLTFAGHHQVITFFLAAIICGNGAKIICTIINKL